MPSKSNPKDFENWHKANAKYMEPRDLVAWCGSAFDAGVLYALSKARRKSYTLTLRGRAVTHSSSVSHLWDVALDLSDIRAGQEPLRQRTPTETVRLKKAGWAVKIQRQIPESQYVAMMEKHCHEVTC